MFERGIFMNKGCTCLKTNKHAIEFICKEYLSKVGDTNIGIKYLHEVIYKTTGQNISLLKLIILYDNYNRKREEV